MTSNEALLDAVLLAGLDDWIQAAEVASLAMEVGGTSTGSDIRRLSVAVIRAAALGGLMRVGDLTEDGFVPWRHEPEAAVCAVEEAWLDLGRGPDLGEICWLDNTDAGDARAIQVSKRRASGAT